MASSWERLASVTLESAGNSLDSGTFTAKRNLKVVVDAIASGSIETNFRLNGDTGSNYSYRKSTNGGSDGSSTSISYADAHAGNTGNQYIVTHIINVADKEKLMITNSIGTTAGASNAPDRREFVQKWTNTSDQITRIEWRNVGSGSFATGSTITVFGADDQGSTDKSKDSITNVPVGTRYEEVNTRKIFRRKGSAVSLTGLKAYFPMNEASGKLINKASDYGSTDAISNFDLTVTGATQNTSGKIDKCVSFSGNQKAEASDSNLSDTAFLSNNNAKWTICFWSKVDGLASGGNIEGDQCWFSTSAFQVGDNGVVCRVASTVAPPNNPAYTSLILGTSGDDREASNSTANGLESGGAGSGTGWHFHVIQYDDSTGIARHSKDNGSWNNIFTGANLTNTDTPSAKFRLGQMANNDNNLNGDMEAFSIWNRVLTASEITTLYGNTTDVGQGLVPSWVEKGVA